MGTNATFRFYYDFLEVEFTYSGSYALGQDFTDIPKDWRGSSEDGESLYILSIRDILKYFEYVKPQNESFTQILTILENFDLSKVTCYPDTFKGFPYGSFDGCMTLETGL